MIQMLLSVTFSWFRSPGSVGVLLNFGSCDRAPSLNAHGKFWRINSIHSVLWDSKLVNHISDKCCLSSHFVVVEDSTSFFEHHLSSW
ncbi:hypothetical protein BKA64DRAFT_373371 [Cadophora sp. MPI-SDFR-AT-0126]|nr:hypothetical protein BKA64DRAFT_373371 [Leotiomycetes sp. MPI-SDFR-AT-0126]